MKVILLENVKNLGNKNDIVNVADGYARNFLFPKKLAKIATEKDVKSIEENKAKEKKELKKMTKKFKEISEKISGKKFVIKSKGEGVRLFGSIGKSDIVKIIGDNGIEIREEQVVLDKPIKEVGEKKIVIKFNDEIETEIILLIELI